MFLEMIFLCGISGEGIARLDSSVSMPWAMERIAMNQETAAQGEAVGSVHMETDGALVFTLHATTPEGGRGQALFRYPPDHPQYREMLRHVAPIEPGEEKLVQPWSETSGKR